MGADIKNLRVRIGSVDSTLHFTKAMGLVASLKVRKATSAMEKSREYEAAINNVISMLTSSPEAKRSPYMKKREGNRVRLIVISGDRGLAGGYNNNIFKLLRDYPDAEIIPIGKRACDKFSGRYHAEHFIYDYALDIAEKLLQDFVDEKFDRLGIVCTRYKNILSQEAQIKWVLPFTASEDVVQHSVIFEPDELTVLNEVAEICVASTILASVRESFACEIVARKNAMDTASKNAQDMLDDLQLEYNMARQSSITQEITEIVAGSEE